MRLTAIEIHGFKRFKEARVTIDGKVTALVGPNGAGKTSVLEALQYLTSGQPFADTDLARSAPDRQEAEIRAQFVLDDADYRALSDIPGAQEIRWYTRTVRGDGESFYTIEPPIFRDLAPRQAAIALLERVAGGESQADQDPTLAELKDLLEMLQGVCQDMTATEVNKARALAAQLAQREDLATAMSGIADSLVRLAETEEMPSPEDATAEILSDRVASFVFFNDNDRLLNPTYDLTPYAANPPAQPIAALGNLMKLGDLNLTTLARAAQADRQGELEEILLDANARLREVFATAWKQAEIPIIVRLRVSGLTLHILVEMHPRGYTSVAEGSDGQRTFVALVAFTITRSSTIRPILLVDEAETHLHYDAQADLVRMFGRQDQASQVIFTTHSAGCLPEDLGTGIKVVRPKGMSGESEILNSYWSEGPGVKPLIIGMGATTFAFSSLRYAVIGEGASEALLLPTLLKEATGNEPLGFQVVPGLAQVPAQDIAALDEEGGRTVYLVDSDDAGRAIYDMLIANEIPPKRILEIGLGQHPGLTLEDLLRPGVYCEAVNTELERSQRTQRINQTMIPTVNRSKTVDNALGRDAPNKTAVAKRVLELRGKHVLYDDKYRDHLCDLAKRLKEALELSN
jgi:ABC-type transport system involved in cytochrome c biogenesis ATPase subunit